MLLSKKILNAMRTYFQVFIDATLNLFLMGERIVELGILAAVNFFCFQLAMVNFFFLQLDRRVVVLRLSDIDIVRGSHDPGRALETAVLRATPVRLRPGGQIAVVKETVVVQLVSAVGRGDVSDFRVDFGGREEGASDLTCEREEERKLLEKNIFETQ